MDARTLRERGLADGDIDHVRAYAAFLKLPTDEQGRKLCPPSFYTYATGGPLPSAEEVAAMLDE